MKHLQFLLLAAFVLAGLAVAQTASDASMDRDFTIATPTAAWTDTGLDLKSGDAILITVAAEGCGVASSGDASKDQTLPLPSAPAGALLARLHASTAPMLVESGKDIHVTDASHLFLGVNGGNCFGNVQTKVHVVPAAGATAAAQPAQGTSQPKDIKSKLQSAAQVWLSGQFGNNAGAASTPTTSSSTAVSSASAASPGASVTAPALKISDAALDSGLKKTVDDLPRRVRDQFNNLGDMVNFVLIGSQEQVQNALEAANWHAADTDNREAAVKAVLQTYEKKDYLTMPMSTLYLFDRKQDFGYEEAEAYSVVASRHHFRIWKAPVTWSGETVWAGAGTHDIGFEKDQRNGKVTHKIDPAVDGERDNIGSTLQQADKVKSLTYYMPPDPVQDARNATGGGYHSDGRVLIVILK